MELQVFTSGLEGDTGVKVTLIYLMRQEAKPSQTPREPFHNCPKRQLLTDLCGPQLALLAGSFVPWGFGESLVMLLRAVDAEGELHRAPTSAGIWGSVCDTAVSSLCASGVLSPHCQWDDTCHKCFLFPSDTTSSNSFRSLAK